MTIAIIISLLFAAACVVALGILSYRDHERTMLRAMKDHDQKNDFRYSFGNLPNDSRNLPVTRTLPHKVYTNKTIDSLFYSTGQ